MFPNKTVKVHSLPSSVVRVRDPDGDELPASLELIWSAGGMGTAALGVFSTMADRAERKA